MDQGSDANSRMTVSQHLDEALSELVRAKEQAQFFSYPPEVVERIDLVRRATAKLKRQIQEGKQPNVAA